MRKIAVLNHKMYMDYKDIKKYIKDIKDVIRSDVDVVVCPSNIFIPYFKGKYDFKLGSQNLSGVVATGEVSANQLKSLDVRYVILGHSDRKNTLGETDKNINLSIKDALSNNISPIVCVGETLTQKNIKKTGEVIVRQLKNYFSDVNVLSDIIIAYEPVWAISSGMVPDNLEIEEVVSLIKDICFKKYGVNIRVIYGGSVDLGVIDRLNKIDCLDGYLFGSVSVNSEKIISLINKM